MIGLFNNFFEDDDYNFKLINPYYKKDDERVKNSKFKDIMPVSMDISETKDKMKVKVDLPGFKKEDVKIELIEDGKVLKISGEKKQEKKEEGEKFHIIQRSFGKFEKKIKLITSENDKEFDVEKISANFVDGILNLDVLKKEKPKPKKIEIKIQ
jgi:HSP20 family molecular chaperone IbpA